jgi:hypothetical protein
MAFAHLSASPTHLGLSGGPTARLLSRACAALPCSAAAWLAALFFLGRGEGCFSLRVGAVSASAREVGGVAMLNMCFLPAR